MHQETKQSAGRSRIVCTRVQTHIGLGVELNEMHHTIVPGVPKVFEAPGLLRGHTEVISEAGKIGLALHTDALSVRTDASVIKVCLMVA